MQVGCINWYHSPIDVTVKVFQQHEKLLVAKFPLGCNNAYDSEFTKLRVDGTISSLESAFVCFLCVICYYTIQSHLIVEGVAKFQQQRVVAIPKSCYSNQIIMVSPTTMRNVEKSLNTYSSLVGFKVSNIGLDRYVPDETRQNRSGRKLMLTAHLLLLLPLRHSPYSDQ